MVEETMHAEDRLYVLFCQLGIQYTVYEHEAAFTVQESEKFAHFVPGRHSKNLFLKDDKKRLWLVVAHSKAVISLKNIARDFDAKGLRFAQPELLQQVLGVKPGSVTLFALINDAERKVNVIIDSELASAQLVGFHPLRNTATVTLSSDDMLRFVKHQGNSHTFYSFEDAQPATP